MKDTIWTRAAELQYDIYLGKGGEVHKLEMLVLNLTIFA